MKKFLLTCFALAIALYSLAQQRTISGKVTSAEDGSALPGVNVVVRGTTNGSVTDSDGNYTLAISGDAPALVFSFIGLQTAEVVVGERTIVDVQLTLDVTQLSEVIVTAQGIAREKKALGYSVASVGKDQIEARPVNDISRILQGKIPGVNITPVGGSAGTGSSINIRGYSSLTGSTQPLWVVDGVPFNSSSGSANAGAREDFMTGGAATSTSRFLDLDPNTIESINVLKGLAATVLYGDQGRNGVILVTTKSGASKKKETEISFQQTTSISEIASLPEYQNSYGNGFQQLAGAAPTFFSNWGPHFSEMDSTGSTFQFLNDATLRDAFPEYYFKRVPYEPTPDPLGFFRKGLVSNTSLTITGGTDKLGYNTSVAYTKEEGYAPGNELERLNISTGFNAALSSKFNLRTSLLFANTDFQTPPLNAATGGGASFGGVPSLYGQFLYTPRNIDVLNDPFETPDHRSVYYRPGNDIPNPLWVAKYTRETEVTNRIFSASTLTYDINENMNLSYRVGMDMSVSQFGREYNKGIGPTYANINNGVYQTQSLTTRIWNHDFIYGFNKAINSDISVSARVGVNARNDYSVRDGLYSEGQSVFGLMRHGNFQSASSRSSAFDGRVFNRIQEQQRYGVYGDFSFDFKNYLFLNLAARNDWTSTLEPANNSLFYPSASVSFVPTDAIESLKSNTLSYLKFRASYGTSAGFPPVYTTRSVVTQNLRGFIDVGGTISGEQTVANRLGNVNLKAELQQEIELGFEAKLFNEKLGIDFTVYDRSTRDLITEAPIDPATGYTTTFVNIGKLSNKGIELGLNATPITTSSGLQWNVIWNLTLVRPKVVELGNGIEEVVVAGQTTLGNFAIPGYPMNIIKGTGISEDGNGNRIVGTDGLYVQDPFLKILGDPNPKVTTSLINSLSFKGVTFSFQIDYRHGGKMYAATPGATIGRGVTKDVDFNHDLSFILPGVRQLGTDGDGNPNYVPNDIQITASDYGFNTQFFGYNEVAMFDATTIRLREISLGYTLPKSLLSKTPIKNVSIMLTGNNLWFNAVNVPKYVNYDTEVSSQGVDNGVGFDYLTGPSVRRYGAVLRLTF
jgi:TonB-linked SusC/RagA family outer membrane protein